MRGLGEREDGGRPSAVVASTMRGVGAIFEKAETQEDGS
jgi:hypothetical protein